MENSWNLDYIVALAERLGLRLMLTTESFNFLCHFKGGACFFPQFVYVHTHTHSMTSHTTPILIATPTPAAAQLQPGQRRPHQHTTRVLYQPHGACLLQAATAVPRVSICALSECAELGVLQRGMRQRATWLSAERDLSRVGNQVDITEGYNSTAQHQWNSEMAKYLKSIDHYGHMITTSMCCHKPDPAVYSIPELDHVAYHSCECLPGPAPLLPSGGSFARLTWFHLFTDGTHDNKDMVNNNVYWPNAISQEFNKPAYLGEFGVSLPGGTTLPKADPDGT